MVSVYSLIIIFNFSCLLDVFVFFEYICIHIRLLDVDVELLTKSLSAAGASIPAKFVQSHKKTANVTLLIGVDRREYL